MLGNQLFQKPRKAALFYGFLFGGNEEVDLVIFNWAYVNRHRVKGAYLAGAREEALSLVVPGELVALESQLASKDISSAVGVFLLQWPWDLSWLYSV